VIEKVIELAERVDRLARSARVQDLSILLAQSEAERIGQIASCLETLDPGTYLIGSGPYTQGIYSVMTDEVILGRLATPLEKPLDKPVDIFCQDVACLTPREASRYHAMVFRLGDSQKHYFIRDLGSSCGTFLNGEKLPPDEVTGSVKLSHGDVISLGPSHVNTYVFMSL